MTDDAFESVFDALADTAADAASMTIRADLLLSIRERVRSWLPQEQAASRLGLTRARLDDLLRGTLDTFSLDAIAASAGFTLHVRLEEPEAA